MSRVGTALHVASAPFRVAAQAAVAVGGGVAMLFARATGWGFMIARTLIDYRMEVGDPMLNSAVAASVYWIARNFAEAPVRIKRRNPQGEDVFILPTDGGPGAMLQLLERPNGWYSGMLQWQATLVDYMQGNAYWIKVRNRHDRPTELWWVPRGMMRAAWPENDPNVFISHYEYKVNGLTYWIAPRDVVHFRHGIDPQNPREGLSPFGALLREVFTDDEASRFTASLLRNLGVPGVILSPANTASPHAKTDPEGIKSAFMEKFGGERRGEPMVLTQATDVKVLSWSPEQMNLKDLRRLPEERITAVLGIPAIVANLGAGLDHSTFTNAGEANVSAYTQGVMSLQRLIAAELEVQLLDDFADLKTDPLDVDFDWTKSAAMSSAVDAIWRRYLDAFRVGGVTRAAFKRATGQLVQPGDDVFVMPNNYVTIPAGSQGPITPGARPAMPALPPGARGDWKELALGDGVVTSNGHAPQIGAPA